MIKLEYIGNCTQLSTSDWHKYWGNNNPNVWPPKIKPQTIQHNIYSKALEFFIEDDYILEDLRAGNLDLYINSNGGIEDILIWIDSATEYFFLIERYW